MIARVTLFDIDTMRMSVDAAVEQFKEQVMPELRKQAGYEGIYVLTTPEGQGLLISLWSSAEAEEATFASGYYAEQVQKFLSLYRSPPGRQHYEISFAESPQPVR